MAEQKSASFTSTNATAKKQQYSFTLQTSQTIVGGWGKCIVLGVSLSFSKVAYVTGWSHTNVTISSANKSATLYVARDQQPSKTSFLFTQNDSSASMPGLKDVIIDSLTTSGDITITITLDKCYVASGCIATATVEYLQIGQSTFTMNPSSKIYIGQSLTLNIKTEDLEVFHTAKMYISDYTTKQMHAENITANQYTFDAIPETWLQAMSTRTTCTVKVELITYCINASDGKTYELGTSTGSLTLSITNDMYPSIDSFAITKLCDSPVVISWGNDVYIQGFSGIKFNIVGSPYDAYTTVRYKFTCDDTTITGDNGQYKVDILKTPGTFSYELDVIDSRGRSRSKKGTFVVYPYAKPSLITTTCIRTDSNGVASDVGGYGTIKISGTVASCNEKNTKTLTVMYSTSPNDDNPSELDGGTDVEDGKQIVMKPKTGQFSAEESYYIYFTVTDAVGNSAKKVLLLETAAYAIHVKNGGLGVAFGKVAEKDKAVEINQAWSLWISGKEVKLPVCGMNTATGDEKTISFTKQFATVPVVVASYSSGENAMTADDFHALKIGSVTTTGFNVRVADGGTTQYSFAWMAMEKS